MQLVGLVAPWLLGCQTFESRLSAARGVAHVSASLEEGDVCLFRGGQWFVDNVSVGDGEPSLNLAVVTCLQLVFTSTCEHGWILGSKATMHGDRLDISDDETQIGPEQVIARLQTTDDGRLDPPSLDILNRAAHDLGLTLPS